jgi:uncharacterized iron-regulated membrane protein
MSALPRKSNRYWFVLHSWLGLKLSLFMSFVLVTGTLAVFSSEMDWATHASMRVEPRPASERASWGELHAAARAAYPDWSIYNLAEPIDPWFAAQAYGGTPEGRTRLIDIDPYTAEVRGDRHWLSFHRFFRNTHRHLMLPTTWGVPIVSALSFVLLGSMITGILVYKKFWRGLFQVPRRGNARRLNGDLHRLCGAWTLWFIPVIALTGLFYFAESLGWQAPPFGHIPPIANPVANPVANPDVTLDAAAIDAMAAEARRVLPGLHIANMLPPRKAGEPLVFQGYTDSTWLVRPRASYVAFNPASGEAIASHRSRDAGLHQRISEMADPLHFGYFGGLPTKVIWFVFGAAMSALSITGIVIYGKRTVHSLERRERARPTARRSADGHRWFRHALVGMGGWKWAGVAAVMFVLTLLPATSMQ